MSRIARSALRRITTSFELRPTVVIVPVLIAVCAPLPFVVLWASRTGASDARTAKMVGSLAVVGAAVTCAAIVTVASHGFEPARRRSWRISAIGLLLYAAGAATWLVTLHGSASPSATGAGDVVYLLAMVAFVIAAMRHPLMTPRSRLTRSCIDAAIVASSITVWLWLAAGRQLFESTDDRTITAIYMFFPTLDLFIVVLCLTAATQRRTVQRSVNAGLLMAGAFTCLLIGDVAQAFIRSSGTSAAFPLVVEAAWICCFVLLGAAAWAARGTSTTMRLALERQRVATAVVALPTLSAVIATVVTVVDSTLRGRVDPTAVAVLMAVVGLALVRQSLTVADNQRLSDSLQSVVDELEEQATHDALTHLPNRAGLIGRIDDALATGRRNASLTAVLFLDLDHLKSVNDSLGHHSGDDLLRVVSSRLVARVGTGVTRFGGDEFVVVLEGLSDPEAAGRIGQTIVRDTSAPMTVQGYRFRPSVSVGVALAEPGVTPEELLRRADVALYRAKSLGRRCVAEYEPTLDLASRRHVDLEPELRRALDHDEFEVHYQPVISLTTGEVVGVESLLRWRHPERGLLLPAEFLDEVAAKGMLVELGRRTLARACSDFGASAHSACSTLHVAVNLSTSELVDERVIDRVADALAEGGLPPRRLTIEITEDVIVDDTIRRTIDRLRSLGVTLAIDDFGTGNSSLRQLGTYPASTLKIDRTFVARIEDDPQAEATTRAILGLARNLGLRTVAEGVETQAQAWMLAELGCDFAQGWRYAKAMPIGELIPYLAACAACHQPESRVSASSAPDMIEASSSATGGRSSITPTT